MTTFYLHLVLPRISKLSESNTELYIFFPFLPPIVPSFLKDTTVHPAQSRSPDVILNPSPHIQPIDQSCLPYLQSPIISRLFLTCSCQAALTLTWAVWPPPDSSPVLTPASFMAARKLFGQHQFLKSSSELSLVMLLHPTWVQSPLPQLSKLQPHFLPLLFSDTQSSSLPWGHWTSLLHLPEMHAQWCVVAPSWHKGLSFKVAYSEMPLLTTQVTPQHLSLEVKVWATQSCPTLLRPHGL